MGTTVTLWGLSSRRVALRTDTTHCTGPSGHGPGSQEKAEKPVIKADISWAVGAHQTDQDAGRVDISFTTHMLLCKLGLEDLSLGQLVCELGMVSSS